MSPATPVTIANGLVAVSGDTPRILYGWSFRATTAGVIRFRDGAVTGQILGSYQAALDEEIVEGPWTRGVATANGIFVEVASGVYEGSVFVG